MELSTMTTRAQQQRNTTATQFNYSDFYVRRPEEYERTLIVLTTRIEESRIRDGYGLAGGVFYSAYCNDNKERRSWNTTVSTCPRTVGNFTRNRGLPTSPCHRSSFKMPSNCAYDSSNFLYLEQLFKVPSNSSGLRTKKSEKSN